MRIFILAALTLFSLNGFAQEPKVTDNLVAKVVIGFPNITVTQLDSIKNEFLTHSQIISAKYVYGNHKEMLILMDINPGEFSTYYDLLKIIDPIYSMDKMYLNDTEAYDFILNSLTTETVVQVK